MNLLKNLGSESLWTMDTVWTVARAALYAVAGYIVLRLIVLVFRRLILRRSTAQVRMLVTKGISYTGTALIVTLVLLELGVQLAPILGAAGIVGLAVGIASQASLSNVISGLFLVSEKPFEIGDVIAVGDTRGVVDSIDLLSIKIRTFDNLYVRIPNEKLANSEFTNITRYPIRRLDFSVTVPFSTDLQRVTSILESIAEENSLCLQEPKPIILFKEFTDSGCSVLFGVWFQKNDFVTVKNEVFAAIQSRLEEAGISIAVPRRLIAGSTMEPISVSVEHPPEVAPELGRADHDLEDRTE